MNMRRNGSLTIEVLLIDTSLGQIRSNISKFAQMPATIAIRAHAHVGIMMPEARLEEFAAGIAKVRLLVLTTHIIILCPAQQ